MLIDFSNLSNILSIATVPYNIGLPLSASVMLNVGSTTSPAAKVIDTAAVATLNVSSSKFLTVFV